MFPLALSSAPSSSSIAKRSRNGVINAFLMVATVSPSRSIFIVSRMWSFFSWILKSSWPEGASRTKVSRSRSALPLTLNARSPCSVSIQKSSPIENSFSRIW